MALLLLSPECVAFCLALVVPRFAPIKVVVQLAVADEVLHGCPKFAFVLI